MRGVVLLICLSLQGAGMPLAQETPRPHTIQMSAPSHSNCFCRAQGRMFAYGESVCLRTPEGSMLAQCQMETNVTSWTMTGKPCPES